MGSVSLHRRAAKRDAVEPEIIDALRRLGWSILRLSVKDGPDLAIAKHGRTLLCEVKTGDRKLRPGQIDFARKWGAPVYVLRSVDDVIFLSNASQAH